MTFEEIKQLLTLVREYELQEFELEREGFKVRIRKTVDPGQPPVVVAAPLPLAHTGPAPRAAEPAGAVGSQAAHADALEAEFAVVKSPIVGTFYRSSEPEAPPFVEIGSVVRKGQTLCIIEAMKLMNTIDSEYEGEVVKVFVENGQAVQYGERLFAIRAT